MARAAGRNQDMTRPQRLPVLGGLHPHRAAPVQETDEAIAEPLTGVLNHGDRWTIRRHCRKHRQQRVNPAS